MVSAALEQRFDFTDSDPRASALDIAFEEWLARSPDGYRRLAHLALRAVGAGRKHLSAKALVEIARADPEYLNSEPYRINNNITSRLARKLVEDYPQLRGVFELRNLTSK